MKLRIGLIAILTNCLTFVFSQSFWDQLYFPDTIEISCFTTNIFEHIFVCGISNNGNNNVYRSVDNAQTWENVFSNGNHAISAIAINSLGFIYIGTDGFEKLITSKDNGENWEIIDLPLSAYGDVIKILCIGQDSVYISFWMDDGAFITWTNDNAETWEHSFVTDHQNEYISDIAISSTGEIFVSVSGYFVDQGGVYKSLDNGVTWEYIGLLNHQVLTIELNSNNDLFAGDWWVINNDTPGIYALYEGNSGFELVFDAYNVTDMVVNSEDVIYASANEGVVRSFDSGLTFEIIDDGLSNNLKFLNIGYDGFLYGAKSNSLVKSIEPIVTGIETEILTDTNKDIWVYPNPAYDILNVNILIGINGNQTCETRIYNLFGELVNKSDMHFSKLGHYFQLNVSNLSGGTYLLECLVDTEVLTSLFIKK